MTGGTGPHELMGRLRPLRVDGDRLYASRGLTLFASEDAGESFHPVARCRAGWLARLVAQLPLVGRVLRAGFHDLRIREDGAMTAIVRGHIAHREPGEADFRPVMGVPRGSRPLGLCQAPSGRLYFGEYFRNSDRSEVHVYGSPNGEDWSVVHTFPPGAVRHVHGVRADPHREGVWVLTGDDDEECGLWFTDDGFRTLTSVARGGQHVRAVSVVPLEEGLIVPTDTPLRRNFVQRFDPRSGSFERLCALPGSAFHAVSSAGVLLVSTAVEPGDVNTSPFASVFASRTGERWTCVGRFRRDRISVGRAGRIFQYPQIFLAGGSNTTGFVFGGGQSVRHAGGHVIRWSVDSLEAELDARDGLRSASRG